MKTAQTRGRILPTLTVLFLLGASVQIGLGLQVAIASEGSDEVPSTSTLQLPYDPDARQLQANRDAAHLLEINRREQELGALQAELNAQEARLEAARQDLTAQLREIERAENELRATMALADRAAEEDISRLVTVYEAMDSEEAAAVFAEMDPVFAAGFIGRLAPATAAEILAGLEPRVAYSLSAIVAGQNAQVPTQ